MKRWAWIFPGTLSFLALLVACEESTSGADFVAVLPDAGADVVTVDSGSSSNPDSGDSPKVDAGKPPEVSACVTCAATNCATQLDACGPPCLEALACAEACDNNPCRERCLRGASSTAATEFKRCYAPACGDSCSELQALSTGIGLYTKVLCTAYSICSPGNMAFAYGDQAGCVAQLNAYYLISSFLPGSGVSLTTLEACAAQESGTNCFDVNSSRAGLTCQIQGTKAIGEPCMEDSQCESSFCPGPDRACAVCKIVPGLGDPCDQGRCGNGLVCGASNTCVNTAAIGASCNASAICEVGNCVAGTCQARQGSGAPCDTTLRCNSAQGLTCSSGKCIPYTVSKPGESCTQVAGSYKFCQNNTACIAGTCDALPKIGEPCDATTGPFCAFPNTCRDGKCVGFVFPYPCE